MKKEAKLEPVSEEEFVRGSDDESSSSSSDSSSDSGVSDSFYDSSDDESSEEDLCSSTVGKEGIKDQEVTDEPFVFD